MYVYRQIYFPSWPYAFKIFFVCIYIMHVYFCQSTVEWLRTKMKLEIQVDTLLQMYCGVSYYAVDLLSVQNTSANKNKWESENRKAITFVLLFQRLVYVHAQIDCKH